MTDLLQELSAGPLHRFADWPTVDVPASAGIKSLAGLRSRLNSHASGRRSGDQFCVYVCDRLVLPRHAHRLAEIEAGTFSLDQATKDVVRAELSFRFATTSDFRSALALETTIKAEGLPGHGRPFLNP